MVSMKEITNAPSTMAPATGSVMNVVKSQHEKGNYIRSRGAALLMVPALAVNLPSHLLLGTVKAVVATGMKVIEIAAAAIGFKDLNLNKSAWTSNYTGQQAAHHLGKGVLGTVIVLCATILSPLSPSILISAANKFGFAYSDKKPLDQAKDKANSVIGWCKNNIFTPAKNRVVKAGRFVADHKKKVIALGAVAAGVAGGVYAFQQGHLEGMGQKIAGWTPDFIKQLPCNLPEWSGIKQVQQYFGCTAE